MISCPDCGAEATPGQRFCGQCGTALGGACPQCGEEYSPGQRFCGNCGHALVAVAEAPLETHVPLTAERRMVSVLFVDLVGFTAFSETRDPEDVRALVTRYFETARQVIERFGGTVDKFIGDAVMAWWGATASQEDDAERAVRAALEVVERVSSLGEEEGIDGLAARGGVMTGEASVGPGGNERGLLLGDLVNSASRVQALAEPGTVLVGSATADLVGGAIELVEAGTHAVKGREEPLVVFRAARTVAERGGRGRGDAIEPPFVGRTSELRLLKEMLHAAGEDGRARLVSLVGQAGIGKSRLIWEFRKYADGLIETVYWHEGRSPSYGEGVALWALAEMIRHRARIEEHDDEETTRRRLAETVAEHVAEPTEREWIRERLAGLLGVGAAAAQERTELFAAARAFFERLSAKGTTVLVFEDLQWADPSLLEFIEELPDWSQNHPILVVTMTRPDLLERRPDWGSGRRGFTSLYVGPLNDKEMSDLITGTVPGIPGDVTSRIVDAAGGVPLFAVEMIRMLLSDGRMVVTEDGVIVAAVDSIEVPTSVQAVISARLDRLSSEDRELARDAAVLGSSFTVAALAALRDETVDKMERRLSDLIRREILELVRDPLSPERGQYRWVQSLLREVAYGRIARADRQALHLRAARYFRDLDEPELAPVAATHFVAAGDGSPDRALEEEMVGTLRRAIDRAQDLHAHEQVLSLVATSLPVVPDDARAVLHEAAARAAIRLSDDVTADRHVGGLEEIAGRLPQFRHRAVALKGLVANETRRSETAREALEAHITAHPDPGDDPDLARVAVYLARARLLSGEPLAGAELANVALGTVERLGMIEETADALVTMGTGLSLDRVNQGMALLHGGLELARQHGISGTMMRALINIGYASHDADVIYDATKQAMEEARRVGDRGHFLFALGNMLGFYNADLKLAEAEALTEDPLAATLPPVDQMLQMTEKSRILLYRGDRHGADEALAEARRRAGDLDDAQARQQVELIVHEFDLFDMKTEEMFERSERRFRESEYLRWLSVLLCMEAAALAGRREWMEQCEEMATHVPPGARDRVVRMAKAMEAIVDGQEEGVRLVREAADLLRRHRLSRLMVAILASAARHLPSAHPARGELADEARAVASEAGAHGLADWVDRATA